MMHNKLAAVLLALVLAFQIGGFVQGSGGSEHDVDPDQPGEFMPWNRDTDRNGIDDLLDTKTLNDPTDRSHVYVDYDHYPTGADRDALERIVDISFAPKYINTLCALDVPLSSLEDIRDLSGVIMVEEQLPMRTQLDVSTRTIKMRASSEYSDTVEDRYAFDGAGITIAILDTGVDDAHPAFEERYLGGYDATTAVETNPADNNGHGTSVAAIALGGGGGPDDEDNEYMGVAPMSKLIDVKVQQATTGFGQDFVRGVEWCIDQRDADREWDSEQQSYNGIDILSVSLGDGSNDDGSSATAQIVNTAHDHGLIVVCAVGNGNGQAIQAPASADKAIAVGAVNDQDTLDREDDSVQGDSNTGPRADDGDADQLDELKPDVVAPGVGIVTASNNHEVGDDYAPVSGTSAATPHVTGMMAVLKQASPSLKLDEGVKNLRLIMKRTSTFPEDLDPTPRTHDKQIDDKWNATYGFGLIDAHKAVWYARTSAQVGVNRLEFSKSNPNEGDQVYLDILVGENNGIDVEGGIVRVYKQSISSKNLLDETDLNGLTGSTTQPFDVANHPMVGGENKIIVTVTGIQGAGDVQREETVTANYKPIAELYTDESSKEEYIVIPGQTINFHGNASHDEEHHDLLYKFVLGDGTVQDFSTTSWIEYSFENGRYDVKLQVKDEYGAISNSDVCVVTANLDPTADAGDELIGGRGDPITFDGTALNDNDHDDPNDAIVLFEWDFDGDDEYEFEDDESGYATHTYDELGEFEAWFRVTDRWGAQDEDSVLVEVVEGKPPKADAGEDKVALIGEEITFNGIGTDEDGTIESYQWNFDEGSGWRTYESGDAVFTYNSHGEYDVRFKVQDNDENTVTDEMNVRVHREPKARIASPENDDSYSSDENIPFDGSGSSDPDGTSLSYSWFSDVDGSIGSTKSFSKQLTYGRHKITLEVTDGDGASHSKTISIAVKDATDTPPTVSITTPTNDSWHQEGDSVRFSATGSDSDGDDLTYSWESGDDTYTGKSINLTLPVGEHDLKVYADDGRGGIGSDSVRVNINGQPIAIITDLDVQSPEGEPIKFDASDSYDPDGHQIVNYSWSSDIQGTFYQSSNKVTSYTLPVGNHTITLTVRDENGGKGTATGLVIVKNEIDWSIELSADPSTLTSTYIDPANFVITGKNDKGSGKAVIISAENVPAGWTVTYLTSDMTTIIGDGMWSLDPHSQDTFIVRVEVPKDAKVIQPTRIKIIGTMIEGVQDTVELTVIVGVYRSVAININSNSVLINTAGDSVDLELTVSNKGNAEDTFTFGSNVPPGWKVAFEGGESIVVARDGQEKVKVKISSPSKGKRSELIDLSIWATSNGDSDANNSVTVTLKILAEKEDDAIIGFTLPIVVVGITCAVLISRKRRK